MKHIIDIKKIKSFKKSDLLLSLELVNVLSKPESYGTTFKNPIDNKQLPIVIVPDSDGCIFQLVEFKDVDFSTLYSQEFREGGENDLKPDIRDNIIDTGFSLEYGPPSLRLHKNGVLSILGGHTRIAVLKEQGVKNVICVVYKGMDNFSDRELDRAFILKFGGDNSKHRPAGRLKKGDVLHQLNIGIQNKTINQTREDICFFVNTITHGSGWSKKIKDSISSEIFNKFSNKTDVTGKSIQIKSFASDSALKDFKSYYPDTDDIKYLWYSTESMKKIAYAIGDAMVKYPKAKEYRVVLHTALLKGWDAEETFIARIKKACEEWYKNEENLDVLYGKKMSPKVKFGYFVPAVSSLTPNMNELIVKGVNDGFLYNSVSTKNKKSLNTLFDLDDVSKALET